MTALSEITEGKRGRVLSVEGQGRFSEEDHCSWRNAGEQFFCDPERKEISAIA